MKTIPLTNSDKKVLVSDEDYPLLSRHKWFLTPKGYVYLAWKEKVQIHRLICPPKHNFVIDHINRNPLDNRRENLRLVTYQHNVVNAKHKNKSGYIGVILNTTATKHTSFRATISKNGKVLQKYFPTAIEAAKQRDRWAKELYGKYAVLNFPTE